MTSSDPESNNDDGPRAAADRDALAALVREVQATHLLVWSLNSAGVLTSTKIPVTDCAQQIRLAGRIIDKDMGEAIKMVESAAKQFDSAAHRWTTQSRQAEDRLRAATAAGKLNEAKTRHTAIRTRIVPVQGLFRRAAESLKQAQRRREG